MVTTRGRLAAAMMAAGLAVGACGPIRLDSRPEISSHAFCRSIHRVVNLTAVNSPMNDGGRLAMSFDGRMLFFASDRETPGSTDIYVSTRDRAPDSGREKNQDAQR